MDDVQTKLDEIDGRLKKLIEKSDYFWLGTYALRESMGELASVVADLVTIVRTKVAGEAGG